MPLIVRFIGVSLILLLWFWHLRRYRAPALPVLLRRSEQWWLPGATTALLVLGQWHSPFIAILRLKSHSGAAISLLVLPDMLFGDDWCRFARILRNFE